MASSKKRTESPNTSARKTCHVGVNFTQSDFRRLQKAWKESGVSGMVPFSAWIREVLKQKVLGD